MTAVQSQPEIKKRGKSSSLGWFVLFSLIVHGLGIWLWSVKTRSPNQLVKPQASTPIDFVVVPPEETPVEVPPETKRIATNDSVAKGEVKPKTSSQSDRVATQTNPVAPPPTSQPFVEPQPIEAAPATPPKVVQPELDSRVEESPTNQEAPPEIKPPPEISKPIQKQENPIAKAPETRQPEVATTPKITKPQLEEEPPAVQPSESAKLRSPVATNPVPPKPQPKAPPSSGIASLLGIEGKNLAEHGNDFFASNSKNASQQALNSGGIDARRDPNFAAYFAKIRRRVRRNWQPSSQRDDKQTVLVFSIQRNGQITDLRVIRSSGSQKVDRQSLAAVQNSAPFPPLPADFPESQLDVEFNFNIYTNPRDWQRGLDNW